jgi:hypothetical protein
VTIVGFQALATLPFLRKFTFWKDQYKWSPEQQKCLLLCSQFLPKLNISGVESIFEIPFEPLFLAWYSYYIHNVVFLQRLHLSLEQVILSGEVNPHPNCQLPKLQRVRWDRPSGDVLSFFNKFRTITELGFFNADKIVVEQVLKEMGWHLTKLVLGGMDFSMSKFLPLCPNLKFVYFYDCFLFKDISGWPQNLFHSLEEIDLVLNRYDDDEEDDESFCHPQQIPKGFFKEVCHKD